MTALTSLTACFTRSTAGWERQPNEWRRRARPELPAVGLFSHSCANRSVTIRCADPGVIRAAFSLSTSRDSPIATSPEIPTDECVADWKHIGQGQSDVCFRCAGCSSQRRSPEHPASVADLDTYITRRNIKTSSPPASQLAPALGVDILFATPSRRSFGDHHQQQLDPGYHPASSLRHSIEKMPRSSREIPRMS